MRHTYQCPLRWSDMDAYGHVNNVVYLRYLEEARIDFMFRVAEESVRDADAAADVPFRGGCVVARHEIDYLRPLFHRHEPVTVETWVTKLNAASATLAYEISDAGTVHARATTVIVPYDLKEERPRRMTAGERAFLEGYLDDSASASRLR
ncbi:thioesterase [Streptomyces daqingensis]|uniref:Thioesterase n=1 Tax=Streptomyces daqingensis TaxID=1472640 RepID=A0ABQ2M5W4_9ACTN|nr:thioesterase family protein [Streptomyces daqingensis]GGO47226.1 thioesterase [Streptomyces daqingensis]